jgi:hypothetical protein
MTTEEFRQLCALAEQRDQKHYSWIRQLLLLASGALTALVAFRAGAQSVGPALWSLRVGWVALGISILLGAFCLHGEVWTAAELARLAAKDAKDRLESGRTGISPIVTNRPACYTRAERAFYISLVLSVLALVVHAVLRS